MSSHDLRLLSSLGGARVEQEIAGDERSAIQTIVQADEEREWLLKVSLCGSPVTSCDPL